MTVRTSATIRSIRELDVPPLIWVLGGCVAVLTGLGAYDALVTNVFAFNLQQEIRNGFNLPVLFSGITLLLASSLCVRLAVGAGSGRRIWIGFAALFAFMAIDEVLLILEDLQQLVGLKWQILYLPIVALAAVLWVTALRASLNVGERLLWIGGAAGWAIAQVFNTTAHLTEGSEPLRPRPHETIEQTSYGGALRGVEEVLEIGGTVLFV